MMASGLRLSICSIILLRMGWKSCWSKPKVSGILVNLKPVGRGILAEDVQGLLVDRQHVGETQDVLPPVSGHHFGDRSGLRLRAPPRS